MNTKLKITAIAVRVVFTILGVSNLLWAMFAFMGGADGKFLTPESIIYGILFLVIGCLFLYAAKRLYKALLAKSSQT